jgi:hypothetical protein
LSNLNISLGAESKINAALQSVIATAGFKGENIFDVLVKLMGKPIDRYLQPLSP